MRIIDWSSDVCSSDLADHGDVFAAILGEAAVAVGDLQRGLVHKASRPCSAHGIAAAILPAWRARNVLVAWQRIHLRGPRAVALVEDEGRRGPEASLPPPGRPPPGEGHTVHRESVVQGKGGASVGGCGRW